MNESTDKLASLFDKLKTYITLQLEVTSLTMGEKVAQLLAKLISNGAIVFFGVFVFLFASLAMAFALSTLLNSNTLGFLLVAVLYLLVAVVIVLCKKRYIEKPLTDTFVKMLFSKNPEEKDDE